MSINRLLWGGIFLRHAVPHFPCPRCPTGHLTLNKKDLQCREPSYSVAQATSPDYELDWVVWRFSALLRCSEAACGEIVVVGGDTETVESEVTINDGVEFAMEDA